MAKPKLYLFVGYPGAGKTTVAKIIEEASAAEHIWADHERRKLFMTPTHSHEESKALYEQLNEQTANLLKAGTSVLFDTNFNFYDDRQHLRGIAEAAGAEAILIWVKTDRDTAHKRAVHESHGKHTRIYGNMTAEDFDRIADKLEPPTSPEQPIIFDGSHIDQADVLARLNLN